MTDALTPDRDLVATLRRIRDTRVEADHDEPPAKDPTVRLLHEHRLIRWVQVEPVPGPDGRIRTDRWSITDVGREWIAEHDKETRP